MPTLNPFQTYSQRENTITNNVLLLLSGLYEVSPTVYQDCVNSLLGEGDGYTVVPNFQQQRGKDINGTVDGLISLAPSTIVIETKIDKLEHESKLAKYASAFTQPTGNVLLHLSKATFAVADVSRIQARLDAENAGTSIAFASVTYADVVAALEQLVQSYPYEERLARLHEHFARYCSDMDLLPRHRAVLRIVPCRLSIDINERFQLYFQPATRGYSDFEYLGVYGDKAVRFVGRVEAEVLTERQLDGTVLYHLKDENASLSEGQRLRIQGASAAAWSQRGWGLENGTRFFLLREFTPTHYAKTSDGGIQGSRFKNLEEVLGDIAPDTSAAVVAEQLREVTWS